MAKIGHIQIALTDKITLLAFYYHNQLTVSLLRLPFFVAKIL